MSIEQHIGSPGCMLSGSKSDYKTQHPTHKVFFNANLYGSDGTKLWFGDVDLTLSAASLQAIAEERNSTIYVTTEQPYRFQTPEADQLERDAKGGITVVAFRPQSEEA